GSPGRQKVVDRLRLASVVAMICLLPVACTTSGRRPAARQSSLSSASSGGLQPQTRSSSSATRPVSFHGVTFLVPADWRLVDSPSCPIGTAAVYVGEPTGASCPTQP